MDEPSEDADVARDKIVMVRLTKDEQKAWQAAADGDMRKLADWVRVIVNRQLGFTPPTKRSKKS